MQNTLGSAFKPFVEDLFPFYACLRHEEPITFCPEYNAWLVSRYNDIKSIISHPDIFSSRNTIFLVPNPTAPRVLAEISKAHIPSRVVVNSDKPVHTRFKTALSKAFPLTRVNSLEPFAREVANRLVDELIDQQRAEILSQFANPLISEIVLTLVGVPKQDLPHTRRWVDEWVALTFLPMDEEQQLVCVKSMLAMQKYLLDLITERRNAPQDDDALSTLLHFSTPDMEPLTDSELMDVLPALFFGFTSAISMIGIGLVHLLGQPERWRMLCDHPEYIPQAVEEILRIDSPNRMISRMTTQEVTIGGVTLPEDTQLLLVVASGNRDETTFANADEFEIQRTPNQHLAFGHGIHYCVGAGAARLHGRVALEVLTQRLPQLRLLPEQTITHVPNLMLRRLERLEVEW